MLDAKHVAAAKVADGDDEAAVYYTGWRLAAVMATINLSTLIASLDLGIVATAIPAITRDFNGLEYIGWYSGACFLLVGSSSALWGKLYKYLSARYVFMAALGIYLVGSIVAAAAPNGIALIVGRALQGLGCSGCLSGSVLIINFTAAPSSRPGLIGIWIGVFMSATILGPVLGGVFTSEVTWRWCFWINLPVGGVAILLQILFLHIPKHVKLAPATWKQVILHMDIPGFSFLLTSLICFTLALEWGGLTKPWSDGSVIATLVLFVVLTIGFVGVEWLQGEYAGVPLRLLKPRMTWANCIYGWLNPGANFLVLFYLPIYFQAVKGTSAITSGVYTLPFMAFYALGAMMSGGMMGKTRMIHPFTITSGLLTTLGAALLWAMDVDTSKAWYIGAQVPFGLGIGLGNQVPVTVLQAFASAEDVAATTGIIFTFQTATGAYFVVAAQSIFANLMVQTLIKNAKDIDIGRVLSSGAGELQTLYSGSQLDQVRSAYMVGIKDVFAFCIAVSAATIFAALLVPFVRMPETETPKLEVEEKSAGT